MPARAGERDWSRALILAPPSANGTPWTRRFGAVSTGFASGWMRIRGARRRRSLDRGFVLSDHADWPALLERDRRHRARVRVWVTHGYRHAAGALAARNTDWRRRPSRHASKASRTKQTRQRRLPE